MSGAPPLFDGAFRDRLQAVLRWRRDVRRFRRDPLPDGTIDRLIAAAALAPSVGNSQPWRFVRVERARAALAAHVDAQATAAGRAYGDERAARYAALRLHGLREAPAVLAIFSDDAPVAGHGLGAATMPETRAWSTVMAVHTLWLVARAEGIGVGWVSILDPARVATLLDVPERWSLIALLCIGWPEEESATPELERRGWQDREAPHVLDR